MVTLTQLTVFLPAALLVAASPGANNLLALRNGMNTGLRGAVIALTGRALAFAVMLGLAAAGLAAALTRSQPVFETIKWLGVAYLAYLGLRSMFGRLPQTDPERPTGTHLARVHQEFLTVAANPKALLLFTAFLPQFVDPARPVAEQLLVLGPIYIAIELVAAGGWALAGCRLGQSNLSTRAHTRIERAMGGVFVGLAGFLATSKH